ncbi:type IV pili twitching motility protein PilT [Brenneria goodwinii]|uniref:Twitching motility protein PilT n=1 Tax=Brenneria goodwinii TaxID=1109412 RepID=A0A0G4JWM2_9GAMM|nr:type IV pilus twitching motility protein PilT [Brenneria goodwinii]ATA22668.1 type IV pili twitching motility protein PilT [Brenneria goodwinii]MCG8158006.1 type IV pilus twitching motility protein PilT [Brenneria goodwinii]MCG8161262.1 type IV pilus twitching motility protein PilT [Brenneria goodwinii]MCG8165372.1 type IV pilus twitching motility protein PilT [Brenneria goodwinii]MCG8171325.1 type IV pilus twitching motility protein PilT [Brenneria goodwinii]
MNVGEWVSLSVKHNASDLHLCSGHPPVLRVDGQLRAENTLPRLRADQLEQWCAAWLEPPQLQQLRQSGQLDCALMLADGQRLRVNLFRQRLGLSAALRIIPSTHPSLTALRAPPILSELLDGTNGLILLTGATGSGKSTTLAAMIAALNQRSHRHVITLEDPIEFIHNSRQCLIQQREIGQHSISFAEALRAALREDPDVILLGELRDTETIRLALTAAETGHLVLSTLHTRSAAQAVDRLVDVFPGDEKTFVRSQLAACLQAVIAQKLLPMAQGGRVALFEILTATSAVSNLIREGKSHQLPTQIQSGAQAGMQTFEQSYQQRIREGVLS